MKYLFIINPAAGKKDTSEAILEQANIVFGSGNYDYYLIKGKLDAYHYTKEYIEKVEDKVAIIACGGDGTLNEVGSACISKDNVYLACFPVGSGNDYIKAFGNRENFIDLSYFKGNYDIKKVDVLEVNDRYALNVCNIGFDAVVVHYMEKLRRMPLISGKMAYHLAVFLGIFSRLSKPMLIMKDGKEFFNNKAILAVCANGNYYGGSYYVGPDALVDDGLLDLVVAKKVTRFTLARLIKRYQKGIFKEDKACQKIFSFDTAKEVVIEGKKDLWYTVDGELLKANKIKVGVLERALNFIYPKGLRRIKNGI